MISKHIRLNMYCKVDISKIENYDKAMSDTEQVWDCHHRLEFTLDGEPAIRFWKKLQDYMKN